jgi:malonyl CoA-acyl carrier protein transacylase/ubiquinone/menaquinone biosynthesis C-methylase UbiE
MAAVMASVEEIEPLLAPYSSDIAIAAINTPQNVVISGKKDLVNQVGQTLAAKDIKVTPLSVSHAFHSPLMEPMLAEFLQVAQTVSYSPPTIPLISNVTGTISPAEITTPAYWCNHVMQAVRFKDSVEVLAQSGYNLFLEIGPRPTLSGMGKKCLPETEDQWLPSLKPGQNDWHQLLTSLGKLYTMGAAIDWPSFDQSYGQPRKKVPTFDIQPHRLAEVMLSSSATSAIANDSPFRQELLALPKDQQLAFLKETIQDLAGQILAGIHPTGSGTELQQHIPEDMLNRQFKLVDEWYRYFDVRLKEKISRLEAGQRVLDLCCGYGVAANTLADEFPDLEVIGVDLNPDADNAKKYFPKQELASWATLIAHDACDMASLDSNLIDFCYCMAGIAYVPDGLKMLQEIHRVLKPGAKAFLYVMRKDDDIAHDFTLEELTSVGQGANFVIHPFSEQTKGDWESGKIPKPYYIDGVILEMKKTADRLVFPFEFEGSSPSLQSPQMRTMESYYVAGHYRKIALPVA